MTAAADLILVTGLSGFIARHVARRLLEEGYRVRGSVRSGAKGEGARKALEGAGCDVSRLEIVEADLLRDGGWDAAVAGCRFVLHTASPFPGTPPRDKNALVPVAEGGTLRVVEAAKKAGVERLVLTSSVVAIYHGHDERRGHVFTEADVSNVESPTISSYAVSKTKAEAAAWRACEGAEMELAVVNPALVLGPLLGPEAGTSLDLLAMMMKGFLPVVPGVRFGIVDVRDVAEGHLAAMTVPEAAGRRFILSSDTRSLVEMGEVLRAAYPRRARLPRVTLPGAAVRLAARVSRRAALLLNEMDPDRRLDSSAARQTLGLRFRSADEAVLAAAESLERYGLVRAG